VKFTNIQESTKWNVLCKELMVKCNLKSRGTKQGSILTKRKITALENLTLDCPNAKV
jgi:hypothetical protein